MKSTFCSLSHVWISLPDQIRLSAYFIICIACLAIRKLGSPIFCDFSVFRGVILVRKFGVRGWLWLILGAKIVFLCSPICLLVSESFAHWLTYPWPTRYNCYKTHFTYVRSYTTSVCNLIYRESNLGAGGSMTIPDQCLWKWFSWFSKNSCPFY